MHRTREKRSFTLSADALVVLLEFQQQTNATSLSAALEKLLQAHRERRQLEALNAEMASYYDHRSPAEVAEEQEWGAFASAQLPQNLEAEG